MARASTRTLRSRALNDINEQVAVSCKEDRPVEKVEPMEVDEGCVRDFDDITDPDYSGEYCKEIFHNETKNREPKWVIETRMSGKKSKLRVTCVDWLTEIAFTWKLATDTLFVAAVYFDKVLRLKDWAIDEMQGVAGTCLLISSKMEEVHAIPIGDMVQIIPGITRDTVKAFEKSILELLEYEMVAPHSMLFIRRYNCISEVDIKTHTVSKYLATLCLRYQGHCFNSQSLLAASIVFLSRRLTGCSETEAWSKTQIEYSGYTLEELLPTVYFVSHVLSTVNTSAMMSRGNLDRVAMAFRVFSSTDQKRISTNPCMRSSFVERYSFLNKVPLESCQ